MNINSAVRREDLNEIQQDLLGMIRAYGDNPEAVLERVDTERIACQPDEESPDTDPETPEEAIRQVNERRRNLTGLNRSRPATVRDISDILENNERFANASRRAASSRNTAWAEQEIPSEPGAVNINGRRFQYSLSRRQVDWGDQLSDDPRKVMRNLDTVREMVSKDIRRQFGDWSRITNIVISGGQLIVNGVMYVPVIEQQYVSRLPLDIADHLNGGCMAPLFDFRYLKKMTNLTTFVCDDTNFYILNIGADLGLGRGIGVSSLFNICRSLGSISIGGETVTREGLYRQESVAIKRNLNLRKRFINNMDGYKLNLYAGTNGLQSYMFSNLRNYATHRGNKGLIRFCGGTLVRAGLAATAGTVNLGVHLAGSIAKTVWGAVSEAARDQRIQ